MGFRPSSHFSIITAAQANNDWAEDDAWDSGSDDDKPLAPPSRKQPTTPSRTNSLNLVPVAAGSSKTSPHPSPLRPNPTSSTNPTSNTNATAPAPIPFKQPSGPTSLNMIRAASNLAPAQSRTPSAHPNLSIGSGTPNSNSNSSTAELSFSYTHVNAPSPSSYPAREGLIIGPEGVGVIGDLGGQDGAEHGEGGVGVVAGPEAAKEGTATAPTTDDEGRASIEVSSPKGRGWTFITGKSKSRGRKKGADEEQEHEKEGYRRWEMSATGSVDFGGFVPDAPDSEESDGEAMVVGDIDVDVEGKGEATVRWKDPRAREGKRESAGEVLEFTRARGSDDGVGAGKRTSASATREVVEEEKEEVEMDKAGVEAIREDADAVVADPFAVLRRAHPYGHASGYNSKPSTPSRPSSTISLSNLKSPERPSKERPSSAHSNPNPNSGTGGLARGRSVRTNRRHTQFVECLSREDINMTELKKLAWSGVPPHLRPIVWPLLLGYILLPSSARLQVLQRKREEFKNLVRLTFARGKEGLDQQIWHQIKIDVPRTRPGVKLWMESGTHQSLERILYVWAIRHPASGYVQGINDLVTPFYQIFLSAYIDADPENYDPACLPPRILNAIEADSFWCLSRLLDGIQDNYISQQPGIHRSVKRMAELVKRIDAPLATHLESQSVEFMQFAFRWMNCLLMREISVKNTIRMWDTYLAEGTDSFSQFHLYVCSAFLVKWSEKLRGMEFQEIIMFLQSLPTQGWTDHEVELLLSEAFLLSSVWHNAQSHFGA
ncbi:RabGAP/TBC [Ceratobasidium sp. AG-I]|nr:RabGAP/TBC [Ceratobasidium sp. AG-I]